MGVRDKVLCEPKAGSDLTVSDEWLVFDQPSEGGDHVVDPGRVGEPSEAHHA
jgi:hypothetical protein